MTNEKMRAKFEAWFATKDFGPNGLRQIDAEYVHVPAATYWIVWQTATLAERNRCLKIAKSTFMPSAAMHYIESGK